MSHGWMVRAACAAAAGAACAVAFACGGGNSTGPTPPPVTTTIPGDPFPTTTTTIPATASQVFVGAGDIAMCDQLEPARQTGRLLATIGGTVFALGDNAYFSGSAQEYRDCYNTTWGSERGRTRPVPGNHEYEGGNAAIPYFNYFGGNAGLPPQGYYSFELGPAWHAIALNSNIPVNAGSPQAVWLRNDLTTSRARCTIAYWHHPLFTSAQNGPNPGTRDFWRLLYAAGADLVLVGHDHIYERFAPQDPDGRFDPPRGLRQFTVGSGGAFLYNFVTVAANSEARVRSFGVLKLTLESSSYEWQFIQTNGAVADSGVGQCH